MRRITKFIYLPAMLMVAAASAWAWDGSGTSEVPYLIKTSADMNALATNVNNGTDYAGTYFRMENNLEYDGTENNYTAIGLYDDTEVSRPFCGIFDGNGKTISGININKDDTPAQGLFGNI